MDDQTLDLARSYTQTKVLSGKQSVQNSGAIDARNCRAISMAVDKKDAAISGGTVKLQGALDDEAENWIDLGSITVTAGKGLLAVNINENDDGMPIRVVRARISGAIANGTIDVYIITQG